MTQTPIAPANSSARTVLLALLRPYRQRIVLAGIALLLAALSMLAIGQGLRTVIDRGFSAGDPAWLDRTLLGMFGLILVLACATWMRFYNVSWLGERVTADLRRRVFDHLLSLPPSFFEAGRTGDVISRLTADCAQLESVIGSTVSIALRNLLMLIGGLVLLFATSVKLTLFVLAVVPVVVVPIVLFGRRVRKLARTAQERVAELGTQIDESIHEIRIVQAYGHEAADRASFANAVERGFAVSQRRIQNRSILIVAVMVLVFGAVAMILWGGGHDVMAGRISAGQLSAFVFYAVMVAGAVGALSEVWGELQRAAGATERLVELLQTRPAIAAPAQALLLPQPLQGAIRLEALSFFYPARPDSLALDAVNLDIRPGETLALVGPSGSGKSTLFQLLLRFYDPQHGDIFLDGVRLRDTDPAQARACMALVSQEPVIFATTVLENVRYACPDASLERVKAACESAFARDFIAQLPEAYETNLGERGVRLSGGQRQRIAIARALLADRPILLLDEATSALDAESERMVQAALDVLMHKRTTLVIAHRLATVLRADRIVVLDHGRIAEIGNHAELLAQNGLYAHLARLQFSA